MNFEADLIAGNFINRYKRFFVDVRLPDNSVVTAHCPNTGKMTSCLEADMEVLLSPSQNPKRKLKFTLELARIGAEWVSLNTTRANRIVGEALLKGKVSELSDYSNIQPEAKIPDTKKRADFLLTKEDGSRCWIEVKNATLREGEWIRFPDTTTTRGTEHLNALADLVKQGDRAIVFFLCARSSSTKFEIARDIDPKFGEAANYAAEAGVEFMSYGVDISPSEIGLGKKIKEIKI